MAPLLGDGRRQFAVVIVAAAAVALVSARPYAGGWNDGSRLAMVESVIDRHTLAIDDSIFVATAESALLPVAREMSAPPGDETP